MAFISWDPTMSVGVEVIDAQHRRIVDYINELDVARGMGDRDLVKEVLLGLQDYALSHFAFEELLMERSGYPLRESHKKVHETFAAHVAKYLERHDLGGDVCRQVLSELKIWLTNHIAHDDQQYAPYIKKMQNPSWIDKALSSFARLTN